MFLTGRVERHFLGESGFCRCSWGGLGWVSGGSVGRGVVETGKQGLARGAARERLEEKWVGRVSERELEVG